ncbi:hypothetical protein B0F90DRAFT_1919879 [Multifurca ochricompacta]|uniref:Uncharacterized protein n=1 Tax=Multifurca ochricompacta TaxID=376703 RepID=A0AAD4LZH6_9AGAM|nr:hypothetical protein B0F90DRAFT_1919879 [Multifurca ochricompacta]
MIATGLKPRGMSNLSSCQDEVRDESVAETSKVELAVSRYPDSELVEDTISDEEHRRLDNLNFVSAFSTALSNLLSIGTIISDCDQLDQKMSSKNIPGSSLFLAIAATEGCSAMFVVSNLYDPPPLIPLQNKGVATSLQVPIRQFKAHLDIIATLRAWGSPFKGNAAASLLLTIESYLDKRRDVYARQTSIVNSSGTGKSRMVDEVAIGIITIPMCLRSSKSQAAQLAVFCWGDSDPDALSKKLHGFVYALLTVTEKRLEDIESDYQDDAAPEESTTIGRDRRRPWLDTALLVQEHQEKLAKAFREHMTVDQGFRSSHDYRKDFFKAVVDEATKFMASCERIHKENRSPSPYGVDGNETYLDVQGGPLLFWPSMNLMC